MAKSRKRSKRVAYDTFDSPSPEHMGGRIRQLREYHDLTCQAFGNKVGVSKAAVSFWENGKCKNIKLETFLMVLQVLQTDFEYLLYGVPKKRLRKRSVK